jgi:hypothetical protein
LAQPLELAKLENGGFKTFTTASGLAGRFVRSFYLTLAGKHQEGQKHGDKC